MASTGAGVLALVAVCILGPHLPMSGASTPYCTAYSSSDTTSSPNEPPSPELPAQYHTTIEANIVESSMSMTAYEYFDHPGNRATLQILSNNVLKSIIFDYQTDEVFNINVLGKPCTVYNLTEDDNNVFFGNHEKNGVPHTFTTGGALHFAKSMGEKYMGQATVRGIQCDWWTSCLYWPQLKSNFTLDYYFTVPNWEDPVKHPQIPVRALAKGIMEGDNGMYANFTHYYDYIDFKPTLPEDTTIFETPKGVICVNRTLTKPVPKLPPYYHYRQEIITDGFNKILQADVWYDSKYRYIRFDYRDIKETPPLYTLNPVTEIHDFHYGVRYVKDQITGQCFSRSITNSSFDVGENTTVTYRNGTKSYAIHMKDPMQLFYLDDKYAYTGKRMARGLPCNVFSSRRNDYPLGNKKYTAVFEYYFLEDGYHELPDDGSSMPTDVPVLLEVTIAESGVNLHISYNFLDFDTEHIDFSTFDVSTCYSESAKLQFQVRFPGSYKRGTFYSIRKSAHTLFSAVMNVPPIRIQNVRLDYDNSQLYISATLLDRSPYAAQFTVFGQKAIESHDDKTFRQTMAPNSSECSRLCVTNPDFVCNSFDYCSHDTVDTCRLSKAHFDDGTVKVISSTCDHYSRTVNGPARQELSLTKAYDNLRTAVYNQGLTIDLQMSPTSTISYVGVDLQVTFGWLTPKVLPSLSGQFSYHMEITIPKYKSVYDSHIYYDSKYRLVRYDLVNTHPSPPLYTTNPISEIHDFSNGIAYTIDKTLGNCSIAPITNGTFDVEFQQNAGYVVKMKNPLEIFSLNGSYRYAGQKTLRGMLCDVFEDYSADFRIGQAPPQLTILQFYFLSSNWNELSEDSGHMVRHQPIALVISTAGGGFTMTYNFYDFSEQHPDLSNFDIRPCYAGNQQRHFLIKFQGNYHPTLDTHLKDFIRAVQSTLKTITTASSLRFQDPQITYDGAFTYYIATMVEQAPYLLDYTKTSNNVAIYTADKTIKNVRSDQACAALCRKETIFDCESFDYCASAMQCQLSKKHQASSGPGLRLSQICDHYSKTVSIVKNIEPTVDEAFVILKNYVYIAGMNISVQSTKYQAVVFNTDVLRPDSQDSMSVNMKHFIPSQRQVKYATDQLTYKGLSVDQCAARCLHEPTLDCLSFDFCFDTGICYLSPLHPSQKPKLARTGMLCDLYGRTYLDSYTVYPGYITQTTGDTAISNTFSADFCAKQCSNSKTYSCKSFDYCPNTKVCTLKRTHILSIPKSAVKLNAVCSHYSRNYVTDFSVFKGKDLLVGQALHFTNVSLAACAELCVQNAGASCKAFTFFHQGRFCNVINVDPTQFQNNITNGTGDLYVRQYFPKSNHGNSGTPQPQPQPQTAPSSGYSSGAMGGLAIAMLIPGMVIGAALLYFMRTKRLVKEEEMRMGFMDVNNDHSETCGNDSPQKSAVDDGTSPSHLQEYDS